MERKGSTIPRPPAWMNRIASCSPSSVEEDAFERLRHRRHVHEATAAGAAPRRGVDWYSFTCSRITGRAVRGPSSP
jgi:hypothetical protein